MVGDNKSLTDLQEELDEYINQFKVGYFSPLSQMDRLTEEIGELAREVNHQYGEKTKKDTEEANTVANELGDVLIATIIMANSLSIDLNEVMAENMKKFRKRDYYRFERKDEKTND